MKKAEVKRFTKPDEIREFDKGRLEILDMGGAIVGRAVLEPGWKWSTSVRPFVKTESCEAAHFQYHVSGTLRVKMNTGEEFECRPGDISLIPAGHDAWVVGIDPVVMVDFQGMRDYAKAKKG
jgi:mannose-6-phosphate isomerase-like protein (cupin superfamily)